MRIESLKERTLNLLEGEISFFEKIDSLICKEKRAVEEAEMETLLALLEEKQCLLAAQEEFFKGWAVLASDLGVSNGKDNPLFWQAVKEKTSSEDYSVLSSRVTALRDLASGVIEREESVRAMLECRLVNMREQLRSIRVGRNALNGYTRFSGGA